MIPDAITEDTRCKEAIFTALSDKFALNDRVKKLFFEGPMEDLDDFRYYFTDEKEIDAFIAADGTMEGPVQRLQISRTRRAWAAVRLVGIRRDSTAFMESSQRENSKTRLKMNRQDKLI